MEEGRKSFKLKIMKPVRKVIIVDIYDLKSNKILRCTCTHEKSIARVVNTKQLILIQVFQIKLSTSNLIIK